MLDPRSLDETGLRGNSEGHDVGCLGQDIKGAGDAAGKLRDAVEIDLRGFDAVVAEKFLHLSDAGPACQEIGGEAVAECVGSDALVEPGFAGGELEGFAKGVFVDVVAADDASAWIEGLAGSRPKPEPWPFTATVGKFSL